MRLVACFELTFSNFTLIRDLIECWLSTDSRNKPCLWRAYEPTGVTLLERTLLEGYVPGFERKGQTRLYLRRRTDYDFEARFFTYPQPEDEDGQPTASAYVDWFKEFLEGLEGAEFTLTMN
jgi:hypothetical protein